MRAGMVMALALLGACASTAATEEGPAPGPARTLDEILSQAPASDWRPLDPANTIYIELEAGRVIIELAPEFAPNHVANIRALARAQYFDDARILRAQDNYVVQWGRPDEDPRPLGEASETVAGEIARPLDGLSFTPLVDPDTYAPQVGFASGFPVATDGQRAWMTHCYGIVGSARGEGLDSGNGGQLYVVIGQSPRNLDLNITLVGRIISGMDLLSTMPRGTGPLGFYETPGEMTPIRAIRVAADVPAAERTNLEVMRTDSASFAAVVDSRRTRRESFFSANPVNRIGVCNVAVPVRTAR